MADWTSDDVATLRAAIATGVKTVSYSGPPARTVIYQDLAEMRSLLSEMVGFVADAAGTRETLRYFKTNKGF